MTYPAQKAAGEIEASVRAGIARAFPSYADKCSKPLPKTLALCESIIQQAITEAVDAAVAPKDKRVKELEAALQGAVNLCERLVVAYSKLADANSAVATVTIAVGSVLTTAHELPEARKLLEAPHEPLST